MTKDTGQLRIAVAFATAGVAIALRLASDWIFPQGGPLWYQGIQAALLAIAIVLIWFRADLIFLKGGNTIASVKEGLLGIPLGLAFGLLGAWWMFRGLAIPVPDQVITVVANNLFFPAVEELEFRGFLLGWLLSRKVPATVAIVAAAALHVLAHPHWYWSGEYFMIVLSSALFLWYGSLVVRTRSLWGAYVAHATSNIFGFLPLVAHGYNR